MKYCWYLPTTRYGGTRFFLKRYLVVNQSPRSRGHDMGLNAIASVHFDYLHSFIYTYYTYMYICMYVQKSK